MKSEEYKLLRNLKEEKSMIKVSLKDGSIKEVESRDFSIRTCKKY